MKTAIHSEFRAASKAGELIKGVSVLTAGIEAKGHGLFIDGRTLETVLEVAKGFAGGVKVKLEHGSGFSSIIGSVSNFRIEGNQLRADLQLLKNSPHVPHVLEIIERQPTTVGLSISFAYTTEEKEKKQFVRVSDLFSVDLVENPAANPNGLFSSHRVTDGQLKARTVEAWSRNFLTHLPEHNKPASPVPSAAALRDRTVEAWSKNFLSKKA